MVPFHLRNYRFIDLEPSYGLDQNNGGRGILLFVRENLITRLLSRQSFPNDITILLMELNLRKQSWLICGCYNPHKHLISYLLQELAKGI